METNELCLLVRELIRLVHLNGQRLFHTIKPEPYPNPNQWRNVISGAPGSKFSKAPLVEVLKARVEHRICTSFLGGPGHVHPENF